MERAGPTSGRRLSCRRSRMWGKQIDRWTYAFWINSLQVPPITNTYQAAVPVSWRVAAPARVGRCWPRLIAGPWMRDSGPHGNRGLGHDSERSGHAERAEASSSSHRPADARCRRLAGRPRRQARARAAASTVRCHRPSASCGTFPSIAVGCRARIRRARSRRASGTASLGCRLCRLQSSNADSRSFNASIFLISNLLTVIAVR